MKKQAIREIFSTNPPESKSIAYVRRVVVGGIASAALLGGAVRLSHDADTQPQPRPTTPVVVEPGDPSPVWHAAGPYSREQRVDRGEVSQDIQDGSPDLNDGFANPGDVMNVPMTDAQIKAQEASQQGNNT